MVAAPVAGWVAPLHEAADPAFVQGLLGPGVVIEPLGAVVLSPFAGEVIAVAATGHSVTLRAAGGAELLIHVGLDTVRLDGEGFTPDVAVGDRVSHGQVLLSFDPDAIVDRGFSLQTPVVLLNGDAFGIHDIRAPGNIDAGETVFHIHPLKTPSSTPANLLSSRRPGKGPREGEREGERDGKGKAAGQTASIALPLAHGLHARPAARLVDALKGFDADITLSLGTRVADARSPVGMMGLGSTHGDVLDITAQGPDASAALDATMEAIRGGLGETPLALPETAPSGTSLTQAALSGPARSALALDGTARLSGVMGSPGLVMGKTHLWRRASFHIPEAGSGTQEEAARLSEALAASREALAARIGDRRAGVPGVPGVKGAGRRLDSENDILSAHLAFLDDPTLLEHSRTLIRSGKSAEFAWASATDTQALGLAALPGARMAARADDLRDIKRRVLQALSGQGPARTRLPEGAIVVAEDLLPSEFVRIAEAGAAGLVVATGGPTSHVAILASDKNIPALMAVGPDCLRAPDGTSAILSADGGYIQLAPTADRASEVAAAIRRREALESQARESAREPAVTQDGTSIAVFANLGSRADAETALASGAQGCGLLRSEFIYLGRATPPGEAEQLAEYQAISDALSDETGERPLVVRTLDAGGDKPLPFIDFGAEDNPALGLRGVRASLANPGMFDAQLCALLSVRRDSPLHVMLPMITSPSEVEAVRARIGALAPASGRRADISLGIMVETPASALIADRLAGMVDFLSVGTNDLTQYTLAMDRGSPRLAAQLDALHPAVLRLVAMTARAGASHGKWVGVCGASASDPVAVAVLLGLGVTELSCTQARIGAVKAVIRSLDMTACRALADAALDMASPQDVRARAVHTFPQLADWT